MSEEALLATIWKKLYTEDSLPEELAYADWCDENGKPERAEYIRITDEIACNGWTRELGDRMDQLMDVGRAYWRDKQKAGAALRDAFDARMNRRLMSAFD